MTLGRGGVGWSAAASCMRAFGEQGGLSRRKLGFEGHCGEEVTSLEIPCGTWYGLPTDSKFCRVVTTWHVRVISAALPPYCSS